MQNANKIVFRILVRSFILSAAGLLLGILSIDDSLAESIFGGFGFYSLMVTVLLFKIHVILWIVSLVYRKE